MKTGRRAFTLLELLLVLLILALFMSMTVPRFMDRGRRNLQLAADQTADLLTMYAQRESLGRRPVALWHDVENDWLVLLVIAEAGTADVPTGQWRVDTSVDPVKLPTHVRLREVRADGEPVDIATWPLTHTPGQDRPAIEVALSTVDEVRVVVLDPYAVAPYQAGPGEGPAADRVPVDLDRAGLAREDW